MSGHVVQFEEDFFSAQERRCGIIRTPHAVQAPSRGVVRTTAVGALLTITLTLTPSVLPAPPVRATIAEVASSAPQLTGRIVRTTGVCGGAARVADTRIPVWALVEARAFGKNDEQILADFPSLDVAQLHAAWAYYARHGAEIDHDVAAQASA